MTECPTAGLTAHRPRGGATRTLRRRVRGTIAAVVLALSSAVIAQVNETVVDVPTRPGVSERLLVIAPSEPKASVVLFAGGHGGLQIGPSGSPTWGGGNFLVRTRQQFAEQGLAVAIIDAPSDRQSPPFLSGFRQTAEHTADVKSVIAWMRTQYKVPVWLVGTSRGTQSVASVALALGAPDGPDGIVLSSTILVDPKGRPVPAMAVGGLRVPVLVVHHEQDGCALCSFSEIPALMSKLAPVPRKQLLSFTGGQSKGDPCEAFSYHGYNGLERDVVQQIGAWLLAK